MKKKRLAAAMLSAAILTTACGTNAPSTAASSVSAALETAGADQEQIGGEITVTCYDSVIYRTFLEEAAKLFEEQYPGTKVSIECFSEMPEIKTYEQDGAYITAIVQEEDPQGRADYISKVSTALMSGKGADLLAMDVLPIHKYVESGQLENLAEYMEQDPEFEPADYRENILKAAAFNNGTWFMPLDYRFNYYTYDTTLIDGQQAAGFGADKAFTAKQLVEIGRTVFDGDNKIMSAPAYLEAGGEDLFTQMFNENYRHFVDLETKSANFTDGEFKTMIETVSELAAGGYITKGIKMADNPEELMLSATESPTNRFVFKAKDNFSLIQETYPESGMNMMITTSGAEAGIEADDEIAGIRADEDGIVPFTCEQAYGINSNSPNKVTAWAFLKFLLSYEIQASPSLSLISLPVHNQARQDKAGSVYAMLLAEGGELDAIQTRGMEEYVGIVEAMSDQVNGHTIVDVMIRDMVMQEMNYFFDGTKTADDVCQVLQSKVELYLNE